MAILGFLAAMLFPVVNRGLAASQKGGCMSNLRHIGVAIQEYSGDHEMTLPYGYWVGMSGGGVSWDDLISSYLDITLTPSQISSGSMPGRHSILICPADRLPALSGVSRRSYAMPRGSWDADGPMGVGRTLNVSPDAPSGVRLASISEPSKTIMVMDYSTAKAKGDTGDNMAGNAGSSIVDSPTQQLSRGNGKQLHQGTFNYLFVDGHVENLKPEATVGSGSMSNPRGMWTVKSGD
ncbi:MAG: hypothetical protein J0I10_01455 [Verrucomicrobia bacterium]|nr:hypothetical protein [Verrucomicrobiota bacterium]